MKMKPLFICYPRCSTCQKALKWLQERGIEVEVRDIVQQNPSEAELEEWIDRSGLVGKKIGVYGCTEIGSGRKFSVRRGYFFILSGCRSRLILFLRRTDQPK